MAEYINRERARFEAKRYFKNMGEIQEELDMLFCMLPAENVSPVRHGKWIYRPDDLFQYDSTQECSCCHEKEYLNLYNDNYCPNCGAKMDLEE